MIWDDQQNHCINELCFRSEVCSIRLQKDCIVVVLEHKIFVYNFSNLKLFFQTETTTNPKGLCEVSQTAGPLVLVFPGLQKGQVWVKHNASKSTKSIVAHDSVLACFALTRESNLLATASTKGTLIRIFNTLEGTLLQEEFFPSILAQNGLWLNSDCLVFLNTLLHLATKRIHL